MIKPLQICISVQLGLCWSHLSRLELVCGFNHFLFSTFFHNIWDNPSHWLSYFSRWLKPPTCEDMGMDQYLLTPFLGGLTSIYQIFWCELQGYKVLTHCHRSQSFLATKKASALLEELLARHSRQLPPFSAGLKGGSGDESLEWC